MTRHVHGQRQIPFKDNNFMLFCRQLKICTSVKAANYGEICFVTTA